MPSHTLTLFKAVLPALINVVEKVLATQLTPYFQNGILGDFLCAYRKNHSCHTRLHLVEDWKQSWDRGELVAMVAMDLSKAFDSLPHTLHIRKLQAYGVEDQSCLLQQDRLQHSAMLCLHRGSIGEAYHKGASLDLYYLMYFLTICPIL